MESKQQKKQRIEIIDALRGLAIVLMVIHHFFYDLVEFLNAPQWLFSNSVFNVLHYIFAGVFICLCGVSSKFSRSNLKRGFITLIIAGFLTIITYIIDMPIIFGILHLLSFCMIFYGLTEKFWNVLPKWIMVIFTVVGTVISSWCVNNITVDSKNLWVFGWDYKGFVSFDYFPILPWIFVFLFGTWLGYYIKENKFPDWFYKTKVPVLSSIGKHSLIIYIIHQPLLFALTMLLKTIIN